MTSIFRKTRVILKEEYYGMLSAESRPGSLRAILDKEFVPKLIRLVEEHPRDLNLLLSEIDKYHAVILEEVLRKSGLEKDILVVDALTKVYAVIPALLARQAGFKPLSYISALRASGLEKYLETSRFYVANPLVDTLLRYYRSLGKLKPEKIARILDNIALFIKDLEHYHDYLVSGLYYDIIVLRLCGIHDLPEAEFKSILAPPHDFKVACKLVREDPRSAVNTLKDAHPSFNTVISMYEDILRFTGKMEGLDLTAAAAPTYIAYQILHIKPVDSMLKHYLLYLRQSVLLKLALVFVEEPSLRAELRMFIERWVNP